MEVLLDRKGLAAKAFTNSIRATRQQYALGRRMFAACLETNNTSLALLDMLAEEL